MLDPNTVTGMVLLIGVLTTSIVTVINAVASHWGRAILNTKLDVAQINTIAVKDSLAQVQEQTNGNLNAARIKIGELEIVNTKLLEMTENLHRRVEVALAAAPSNVIPPNIPLTFPK